MGLAPHSNLEILCRPGIDFDQQGFERVLLRDSHEVTDAEFSRWEHMHAIEAQKREQIGDPQSALESWRPSTRDPGNLILAYQKRENEIASDDEKRAAAKDIHALCIPPGLSEEHLKAWVSTSLLASPFVISVRQKRHADKLNASKSLAKNYGLGITEARRLMETVHNWLSFLGLRD